jgi:hypothetical protein
MSAEEFADLDKKLLQVADEIVVLRAEIRLRIEESRALLYRFQRRPTLPSTLPSWWPHAG